MTRVLTMGTYDLLHAGHVAHLRRCRDLAGDGQVVVGLNTDRFAASYKRPPTLTYAEREAVLAACRYVDAVVPNDQPNGSSAGLIEGVAPDLIVISWDWHPATGRDYWAQIGVSREWVAGRGIRFLWLPHTAGISTTDILARG